MSTIRFFSPPMPHYILSGEDTYSIGTSHSTRKDIGVFDLIVVASGGLFMEEDGQEFAVSSGQYLLLRPDRSHRAVKPCKSETHFYWVHFQTLGAWEEVKQEPDDMMHPIPDDPFVPLERFSFYIPRCQPLGPLSYAIFDKINMLNQLSGHPLTTSRWKQQVVFQELLFLLQEQLPAQADIPHIRVAEQVAAFLRQHYMESISYQDLSKAFHFHPNYISRCMKRLFGCTPLEYLTRYRIEQAKQLLARTDIPVSRVAERAGFGSLPFFIRCFGKRTGLRPREYRLKYRD